MARPKFYYNSWSHVLKLSCAILYLLATYDHLHLIKLKNENSVPQIDKPHLKCSVATRGSWPPHWSVQHRNPSLQEALSRAASQSHLTWTAQRGQLNPCSLPSFLAPVHMLGLGTTSGSIKNLMKAITQKMHLCNYAQTFAYNFGGIMSPPCDSCPLVHSKLPQNPVAQATEIYYLVHFCGSGIQEEVSLVILAWGCH